MPELRELPRALRVSQVAKLLGVARSTVYGWVNDGVLSGCQIGKVVLAPLRDRLVLSLARGDSSRPKRPPCFPALQGP